MLLNYNIVFGGVWYSRERFPSYFKGGRFSITILISLVAIMVQSLLLVSSFQVHWGSYIRSKNTLFKILVNESLSNRSNGRHQSSTQRYKCSRLFSTHNNNPNDTSRDLDSKKNTYSQAKYYKTDIPLVFVPGMKGTHLSFIEERDAEKRFTEEKLESQYKKIANNDYLDDMIPNTLRPKFDKLLRKSFNSILPFLKDSKPSQKNTTKRKVRAWLTLSAILNFPPKPDYHSDRCLALPLTYTNGKQDKGHLFPDGVVDHIIELGYNNQNEKQIRDELGQSYHDTHKRNKKKDKKNRNENKNKRTIPSEFFPFYGHVTKHLDDVNELYLQLTMNEESDDDEELVYMTSKSSETNGTATNIRNIDLHCRPTATFSYDWRRSVCELCTEFHQFCETTFPNQPVQVVAHSMGGLLTYGAMRKYPEKYSPGAVLVGVPFGTGIQYLEDLHKGYYTEIGRCRQFTPRDQFTFSSHWSFFPVNEEQQGDTFVDVTNSEDSLPFEVDKSAIGKLTANDPLQSARKGQNIKINFYDVDDWERHQIGIFDPMHRKGIHEDTMLQYKEHMKIQLEKAKQWRMNVLSDYQKSNENDKDMPPLVILASDTIPTVNQILRRKRVVDETKSSSKLLSRKDVCKWEYDYSSGRSVPGDGRIFYDGAFPNGEFRKMKKIRIKSAHPKQMCWEDNGGSFGVIWDEVVDQIKNYKDQSSAESDTVPTLNPIESVQSKESITIISTIDSGVQQSTSSSSSFSVSDRTPPSKGFFAKLLKTSKSNQNDSRIRKKTKQIVRLLTPRPTLLRPSKVVTMRVQKWKERRVMRDRKILPGRMWLPYNKRKLLNNYVHDINDDDRISNVQVLIKEDSETSDVSTTASVSSSSITTNVEQESQFQMLTTTMSSTLPTRRRRIIIATKKRVVDWISARRRQRSPLRTRRIRLRRFSADENDRKE